GNQIDRTTAFLQTRHIFTEMARLQESGSPIDLITLAESLERQGNQIDRTTAFLQTRHIFTEMARLQE
ncbi:DnaB-like helicase N-terminal domain-containing protein, partial [Shigella sonnei]|nr:DnaB-like helicase N-terminal domain-containing protein [Shigella sonnei]